MAKILGIAVLIVFGAIIADLVIHPTGTGILINGISGLWRSGLQAAGGQQVTQVGLKNMLGAGGEARSFRPARSSTVLEGLNAIFGEANPAQVTDTPRVVGIVPTKGEPIHGKPLTVANGWIDRPSQTKGMSVLYIDQIQQQPDAAIQGATASVINHSRYAPYHHVRNGWWMYSKWDPIFRFANTAMDMRFQVGKIAPLTNATMGNLPGGVAMGPFAAPYRTAYQIPRFSTEPATVIPRGQLGR